ncbi:MAG: GNAT family N-acetyltransferase [Theionarchaea archaeon]|nr:GNAT family N-acetyltransferase [Theionarchaea archaeon]
MVSRIKMYLHLREQHTDKSWDYRTIAHTDIDSVGALMLDSFRNTIDYEGETLEDAVVEVGATLEGKYGPFLEDCSYLIEDKGQPISACIVVYSEEMSLPLIAYTMTHPCYAQRGMATFLLKKSLNALLARKYKGAYLVVTEGNQARHLYERIGFRMLE